VASAAATARRCRLLAACFGGLGAALIVEQVVRTALAARRRRRLRSARAPSSGSRGRPAYVRAGSGLLQGAAQGMLGSARALRKLGPASALCLAATARCAGSQRL